MNVRGYASTHVGRRENNEDAYLVDKEVGLYVVADGMGGYEGGEIASQTVVDTLHAFFRRIDPGDPERTKPDWSDASMAESRMQMAIRIADREIIRQKVGKLSSMGSTVAAMFIADGSAVVAHVGDSRVYRQRDGELELMTRDHSLYAEMLAGGVAMSGDQMPQPYSNVITRAVGVEGSCRADIQVLDAKPGDKFLLCTDGLSDVLSYWRIAQTLSDLAPYNAVDALVSEAYCAGSADNITAIVVEIAA